MAHDMNDRMHKGFDAAWEPETVCVDDEIYASDGMVDLKIDTLRVQEPQKPTHIFRFSQFMHFSCPGKVPNRFHRWMMKRLFGWEIDVL